MSTPTLQVNFDPSLQLAYVHTALGTFATKHTDGAWHTTDAIYPETQHAVWCGPNFLLKLEDDIWRLGLDSKVWPQKDNEPTLAYFEDENRNGYLNAFPTFIEALLWCCRMDFYARQLYATACEGDTL